MAGIVLRTTDDREHVGVIVACRRMQATYVHLHASWTVYDCNHIQALMQAA